MHTNPPTPSAVSNVAGAARAEDHIQFLDYIRGIAIVSVFVFHGLYTTFGYDQLKWNGWVRNFDVPRTYLLLLPTSLGRLGVAIFFVVSGFCIHLSHIRSGQKGYRDFFWRRFFRLYPAYLVTLLVFSFIDSSTRVDMATSVGLGQFFSHLFLVHNLFPREYVFGINGALWSIGVEVQLYALYPLLLWIVRRHGWKGALWVTAGVEISARVLLAIFDVQPLTPGSLWFGLPFCFWFSWTIGAVIADDMLHQRPIFLARCPPYIWPGLLLACLFFKPTSFFAFLLAALATANVIAILLTRRQGQLPVARGFWAEQLRWAGLMSYSIYLLHVPFMQRVPPLLAALFPDRHFHPLLVYLLCLLTWWLIWLPSWVLYQYVELPGIAYGRRFIKKMRQARAGAVNPAT